MTTVGLVTCARSDLSFYLPLMRAIKEHPWLELRVIATGMHLSPAFGLTVRHIEEAGFGIDERVESLEVSDTPEGIAASIGNGVRGFSHLFASWRPDILLVLGDRFDMYPAALAALPFCIPVGHIGGGELTHGAIDDALRHSLTKLSHLHFVAMEIHAQRVIQMGEEPWRVAVSGSLALDNIRQLRLWTREETARVFRFDPKRPLVLVSYHPVTLDYGRTQELVDELLAALERSGLQCVFTYPNADTESRHIIAAIERFCASGSGRQVVVNAGQVGYLSLMKTASVLVGNSSSGLIEAPSFELPVVNVGRRQAGRERAANVIDTDESCESILAGLRQALSSQFRAGLAGLRNPYGDGHAAGRVVERLAEIDRMPNLLRKKFMLVRADGVWAGPVT